MRTFVVFSALLMLSLNLEVNARCQPNDCSVWNIVTYREFFTPACNKRDTCYACVRSVFLFLYKCPWQSSLFLQTPVYPSHPASRAFSYGTCDLVLKTKEKETKETLLVGCTLACNKHDVFYACVIILF